MRRKVHLFRLGRVGSVLMIATLLASLAGPPARVAHAANLTVSKTTDSADSACDADCSLREAIIAANVTPGPDTVSLPAGTYRLSIPGVGENAAATGDLDITGDLTLTGAGAGSTIVDGGALDSIFDIRPGANVEIAGITLRNGRGPGYPGGLNNDGTLRMHDCAITGNQAVGANAGGFWNSAVMTLDSCVVSGNTAALNGGGIYMRGGSLAIVNSTIADNVAQEFDGGGIGLNGGTLTIENSTISGNRAGTTGGGIANAPLNGTMTLTNVTLSQNSAPAGGGISNVAGGTVTLIRSALRSNTATSGNGGGLLNDAGAVVIIEQSTLDSNSSGDGAFNYSGGAIYNAGTLTLTASALSRNRAPARSIGQGGGLYNSGTATLTNATVSDNFAFSFAAGIFNSGNLSITNGTISSNSGAGGNNGVINQGGTATLRNTIVAYNTTGSPFPVNCFGPITSGGYNLSPDTTCATGGPGDLTNADPLLDPLGPYGGPTETRRPRAGSPAIDAVFAGCPPPTTDQRGVARPQRARCDIGAFEVLSSSWYVAKNGNDANNCQSPAAACATIGAAIAKAAAGDPISVAAGVYRENLSVDKNLALSGAGPGATIIDGGGAGSVLTISNAISATISGVTIQNGQGLANGGGVANNGTLTLKQSLVIANTAAQEGGGVDNNATLVLVESTISGNRAGAGGGIHNNGLATLTIATSTISGNSAGTGGGILNGGTLSIEASAISGNQATTSGGGLWIGGGSLSMINSTISGNRAADGAGLLIGTRPVELTNDTIADNIASKSGGGISNTSSVPLSLANNILAGNSAPTGPDCVGALVSQGGNIIGSSTGCTITAATSDGPQAVDVVGADARLSALRDNGGPTFTHALLAGSPALDAATSKACPATDQRGVARPQGAGCDSGAFEASAVSPGAPTQFRLAFSQEPGNAQAGQSFAPQPVVVVLDELGNQASFDGQITLELVNNANIPGASLSGPVSVAAIHGEARFSGLSIGVPGSGFQLRANATGVLSATSALLNITAAPPPPGSPPPGPQQEREVNDTIEQANSLVFTLLGDSRVRARLVGTIRDTHIITPDIDVFSFYARPGALAEVALTQLAADYDVLVLADPRETLPISDNIDLSNMADLPRASIPRASIPRASIPRASIPRASISGISSNVGTADELLKVFLPRGGLYFVMVYGADENQRNSNRQYQLDVTVRDGGLMLPAFRAHSITQLQLARDPDVQTIYLYHAKRLQATYPDPAEAAALVALKATLDPNNTANRLLAGNAQIGKGATIDLSAALTLSDTDDLIALYNQWDANPDQPLLSNEVAQQLWYVLDYALTNVYPGATSIVLVGNDDIIPFYRVPDETELANEHDYYNEMAATGAFAPGTPLRGSLFNSFTQTDNFYADRAPTPWRGRALYLPDLGIGRLVERPSDIMRYLASYIASDNYTIDTTQPAPGTGVFVTGYDFLIDQADAITSTLLGFGFGGSTPLTTTVGGQWDEDQLTNTWFSGQLPLLTDTYDGPATHYYLTSLNGHFNHAEAEPAIAATGVFSAERIFSPTVSLGREAVSYFKINGAPTLIYSVGCHSGLNVSDAAFGIARWQADFPQAVLKQGGNWIGNTSYGYGDTALIGYSERLSLKFTEALGRWFPGGDPATGRGAPIGDSLARAKRQYLLANGSNTFNIYDEKILEAMTLFGLPFIRMKVPHARNPQQHPAITEEVWAGLGDANGVFTRQITLTNSFTLVPLGSGERVPRATSVLSDSFLPMATTLLVSEDQMAQGRPVLPLLSYDLTLQSSQESLPRPIPRGVRLVSATTLPEQSFRPHVTATLSDQLALRPRPPLMFRKIWTPELPYTFQRTAEQVSATEVLTSDTLLVTPAQFNAQKSRSGKLRLYSQMVFEITYVNQLRAQPSILAQRTPPLFRRVQITSSSKHTSHPRLRFRATVAGVGIRSVRVIYTTNGVNWQRAVLTPRGKDRFEVTLRTRARGRVYAFFEALDQAGNLVTQSANRRFKQAQSHGGAHVGTTGQALDTTAADADDAQPGDRLLDDDDP